jgi:hypothetical protein
MSQRGIREVLVELTVRFGEDVDDRSILGRKGLELFFGELRELERTTMQAFAKGGIVVVQVDGALITTYNVDSYSRTHIHGG